MIQVMTLLDEKEKEYREWWARGKDLFPDQYVLFSPSAKKNVWDERASENKDSQEAFIFEKVQECRKILDEWRLLYKNHLSKGQQSLHCGKFEISNQKYRHT